MSDQDESEDPQFETDSVEDLAELLGRAANWAERDCGADVIAAELRDGQDFVEDEIAAEPDLVTDGGEEVEAEIEQTKEQYSDVLEFTTAETTEMNLDTDHVKAKVEADLGMKILQDGRFMGLSVSTLTGKNPRVSTFLGLTPSQAREIAAALNEAADNAEAVGEKSETPDDSETVFGRIKEALQ